MPVAASFRMTVDPALVYRIGRITNGSNVHEINNKLGTYFASVELFQTNPSTELEKHIEQIEKELIALIHRTEFVQRTCSFEVPIVVKTQTQTT